MVQRGVLIREALEVEGRNQDRRAVAQEMDDKHGIRSKTGSARRNHDWSPLSKAPRDECPRSNGDSELFLILQDKVKTFAGIYGFLPVLESDDARIDLGEISSSEAVREGI